MEGHVDKVRYSHDGHDFHFLWAARQALRLLDPHSDLEALSIEGISAEETAGDAPIGEGTLVVDSTEYYGSEQLQEARRVVYSQLKHSTTDPNAPWTAAKLAAFKKDDAGQETAQGTLKGFADRFTALSKRYGPAWVDSTVRFQFITNRPIHPAVLEALTAARIGPTATPKSKRGRDALQRLQRNSGVELEEFSRFARILHLNGGAPSRSILAHQVAAGADRFLPGLNTDTTLKLKALAHSKALSDARTDPLIRLETLLHALGIADADRLFPSPPKFETLEDPIPREQEPDIAAAVIGAQMPVVIHAPGGVGKSVLAARLPSLMPPGSVAVVFDGFAGGSYRSARDPRHLPERGLVQIANELARQGLCDPLLPLPDTAANYFIAFDKRLRQAAESVTRTNPEALVLIVLDAADNSVTAARETQSRTFAQDLLQEPVPGNCRLVALARTERLEMLDLPANTERIPLQPFSPTETTGHLRARFPKARERACAEFHRLTGGNPRVQANELDCAPDLDTMLHRLGPSPKSVDQAIAEQLETALQRVTALSGSPSQTNALCTALAALPPRIPCGALAQATGLSEAAVHSFAADLGRPLMLLDDAVQFRDEPVEEWFHKRFNDRAAIARLADAVQPLAEHDGYAAMALPRLLYAAGRMEELLRDALSAAPPTIEDPVERRQIVLRRVQFALKAALETGQITEVAKLLLRAAEEVSTHDRQLQFLLDNADLLATLVGPEHVQDLLYREGLAHWMGAAAAHNAAMLAPDPRFQAEATAFLRQAERWVQERSRLPDEEREKEELKIEDIAAMAYAVFHLFGPMKAVDELARWRPRSVAFDAGRRLATRLLEAGHSEGIATLARAAQQAPCLLLALALEANEAGQSLPRAPLQRLVRWLRLKRLDGALTHSWRLPEEAIAVVAAIEMFVRTGGEASTALRLLDRYRPPIPDHPLSPPSIGEADARDHLLRFYTLRAALRGEPLTLEDLLPDKLRQAPQSNTYTRDQKAEEFKEVFRPLLPWYQTRAQLLAATLESSAAREQVTRSTQTAGADAWRLSHEWRTRDLFALAAQRWLDVAALAGIGAEETAAAIETWLGDRDRQANDSAWTELSRRLAHFPDGAEPCIRFAARVHDTLSEQHLSARYAADSYAALARAVLPVSRAEASAYFQLALESLDRIDDDARPRVEALFDLARTYGECETDDPREAYRLARVAELMGEEYDSHKFPWGEAISRVARLCPNSGLAILSRWRDRGTERSGELLLTLLSQLLERGLITPGVAVSLRVLDGPIDSWGLDEFVTHLLNAEPDPTRRGAMLDLLVRDAELDGGEGNATAILHAVAERSGMSHPRLTAVVAHRAQVNADRADAHQPPRLGRPSEPNAPSEDEWQALLCAETFTAPEHIDTAFERLCQSESRLDLAEFFARLRTRVPLEERASHLHALVAAESLDLSDCLEGIAAAEQAWQASAALRRELPKVAGRLIRQRAPEMAGQWYALDRHLTELARLSGRDARDLLLDVVAYAADHVDHLAAASLYALAGRLGRRLAPNAAGETLCYALDRFERQVKETDGDGPWQEALRPPVNLAESIAGFMWAALAAPAAAVRWRAAHAVRRLVHFDEQTVITPLVARIEQMECPLFTDQRLPFYPLHARLYLLIGLARAAAEHPERLAAHARLFPRVALEGLPHVLLRHFAAQAALTLEAAAPGTYPPEVAHALKKVNQSPFPPGDDDLEPPSGQEQTERPAHFELDFEPYWFEPLARRFGISTSAISARVAEWVDTRWKAGAVWNWNDDPRARRGLFQGRATDHSHGSYPRVDRYSFYLTYHALFCTAGELIAQYPVLRSRWADESLGGWISRHTLARPDGRWLADWRDPIPLEHRYDDRARRGETWRWEVNAADFDRALGLNAGNTDRLVVHGHWGWREWRASERILIESALVAPNTAMALLRALQTDSDPHDYRLPPEGDSLEINVAEFELTGWLRDPEQGQGLDELDPLAGGISYPGPLPGRRIRRLWHLIADPDQHVWRRRDAGAVVFTSERWTAAREPGREPESSGERLVAELRPLLAFLAQVRKELMIEVQIRRDQEDQKTHDHQYIPPYSRLYLLCRDGTLHTLRGHRRLGAADDQGTGA